MNLTIYHNPRCRKSRETLDRITQKGNHPRIVEYLKTPLKAKELKKLLDQLELEPEKIIRKKELLFKELKLNSNPPKNKKEWLKVLEKNPVLIERPIVTNGKRAIIGRPPENVDTLL